MSSSRRIVLTVNYSPWSRYSGGGQRSTHELACALTARGHEVTVVYTKTPFDRIEVPALPYRHCWAGFFGLRSGANSPLRVFNALSVARVCRRLVGEGAEVVHSQGEEGALVAGAIAGRAAFVLTPRYPKYPEGLRDAGLLASLRWHKYQAMGYGLRRAARFCPTSRAALDLVCETFELDPGRATLLPNGVAPVFFEVERAPEAEKGPILFFGRLSHTKGADLLIEAVARLGETVPVVMVGRGPEREALGKLARRHGAKIDLVGWRSQVELASLLAGASLAVLPSYEESFGNAMAEAMAAGVPLVSTRVGSVPEVVGEHAVLVPAGDVDALAAAIEGLRGDPVAAEAMGRAGRARIRDRYSWDATAQICERVYDEVSA